MVKTHSDLILSLLLTAEGWVGEGGMVVVGKALWVVLGLVVAVSPVHVVGILVGVWWVGHAGIEARIPMLCRGEVVKYL